MLLGAYYMILDSTWDKLIDISEFVEDAEVITRKAAALDNVYESIREHFTAQESQSLT